MPHSRATVRSRALWGTAALVTAFAVGLLGFPAGAAANGKVAWLCRPGKEKHNPCRGGTKTTLISPSGERLVTKDPARSKRRRDFDCFYVYPTVSDQQTTNANLHIDPEERSIALYQAARYSQVCRVYAPVYRQVTLKGISDPSSISEHAQEVAYNSALRAWKTYLRKYNDGRGVVLIGHSQGTFVLRQLIADQIDPNPALRDRLVSAILLGGNVTVADGRSTGGDFKHIPACRSETQLSCVVAFSTFNAPVPDDSLFGRTTEPGLHVLCTNPAALGGGSARLRSIQPSKPFAPNTTIGSVTPLVGFPPIDADTRFAQFNGAYSGQCSSADGANVLQLHANDGAPDLNAVPSAQWGLHLVDANIALGNLVGMVRSEIRSYAGRH
jgi:pimeloyl-ACP methyl ester carboxylesterase